MRKSIFSAIVAMCGGLVAGLGFGGPAVARPAPLPPLQGNRAAYSGGTKRSRIPGEGRPAGSKLARMAAEGRLGTYSGKPV